MVDCEQIIMANTPKIYYITKVRDVNGNVTFYFIQNLGTMLAVFFSKICPQTDFSPPGFRPNLTNATAIVRPLVVKSNKMRD